MFNDRNIVLFLSLNLGVFSARRILWQRSVFFPYAWFQSHNQYVPPDYEISPPDSPRLAGGAAEAAWLAVWFLPSSGGLQKLSEVNFPWSFTAPVKPSFRKSSFFWTTARNAAAEMVYVTGWITTCWKKKTAQTAACRNMNRVVCWFSISQIYLLFLCCFYVYVLLSAILQISFPPLWFFLVQWNSVRVRALFHLACSVCGKSVMMETTGSFYNRANI